ncbi:YdcF family protein [Leucothrix pacifica]|uniref:YdcF family protein n=1 Tax=Leucothrix pacifica TaxID=1247513 RepID=A0A317CMF5_9GAMM|nr:YdcF family protein [Leucothrix pacifica]PWQ98623.1 YdcF family protein [Leucothrix pacifica]
MILLHRTIEFLLYPPGNLLLFLLLGLLFYKYRKIRITLAFVAVTQLLLFSLPVVSNALMASLENQYPPQKTLWKQQTAQAIVVLGGGRNDRAIEYGGITVSSAEMDRLRYAALLHRKTGAPILLTGGDPIESGISEAQLMQQVLKDELGVSARWIEGNSHTTWENAVYSDKMLQADGIETAWLVTHAWHMPRSMQVFEGRSVKYLAASHSYGAGSWDKLWFKWMPQASALGTSNVALHEWLGYLWYKIK